MGFFATRKHFEFVVGRTLEYNQLSGAIPPELGHLPRLERIFLDSNNLTGKLPGALAKLATLKDFRISDNHFTGKIPDFFQNWTNLEKLVIQASGLDGPIPSGIAVLTKLSDLRVSDLSRTTETFPPLSNLKNLETLLLRSCNIIGQLPEYLGAMEKLKVLDLSFNKLNGHMTSSFIGLSNTDYVLKLFPYCGGREANVDGNTIYEEETDSGGPSRFFQSRTNWAFSSTGHFMDDEDHRGSYIWTDTSRLYVNNSNLYMDARLSPLSLTYYGFCLLNGNYKVRLHFAEIMFTDDKTYRSLGRRIFDVYIEGKLVLKDFNIEEEAGGVGKEIIKTFSASVTNSTLEFQFIWSGKGTTGIPFGEFILPSVERKSISPSTFVGIVVALGFSIFLLGGILWWTCCLRRNRIGQDLKDLDPESGSLTLKQIKDATNNFDAANKIGEGGFGPVYMGTLSDGSLIALKQLSSKSKQGKREFVNEVGIISALKHPHLLKLYGCCTEGNQLLLVYEYMENNCLARALFGPNEKQLKLDWQVRHKICIGIARGLAYLREESRLKIVHRDIKATNVLLDKNLDPKISDFDLVKLDEEDKSHISTRIAGTLLLS